MAAPLSLHSSLLLVALLSCATATGCDRLPWEKKGAPKRGQVASGSEDQRLAEARAAQAAADAQAAEEARKKEAQLAAEKEELEAKRVEACCQELARAGFEGRSMELMGATDVCRAAQKENEALAAFVDDLKAKLEEESLPEACVPR